MDFLYLVLTVFIVFGALILANHFWGKDALFVIGIGSAIGASVYNIEDYGIQIGNVIFGIDSIVYTVFVFILLFCFINYGEKSTWALLFSAMGSILLTAVLQFIASCASIGFNKDILLDFASYLISILSIFVSMICVFKLFKIFKNNNLNDYLNLLFNILIASIIASLIYLGLMAVISGFKENFLGQLGASYIAKLMSTAFSLLTYFICTKFPYKKNLENNNQNKNL